MRKLRGYLILIILLASALIGGTKYLLWYYTDQMAKHIQSILPQGTFSYNGITTSLEGKSGIDNIVLSINGDIIHIKQIELDANNLFSYLFIIGKNWTNKLPDELTLNFKEIDISGSTFFAKRGDKEYFSNCRITSQDYRLMGYNRIITNAKVGYKTTDKDGIQYIFNVDIKDIGTFSGDILADINPMNKGDVLRSSSIPKFHISMTENKLQQKIHRLCAQKAKISLEDYLKQLTIEKTRDSVDLATTMLFNFVLDEEVIKALNQYEKKPISFDLSLNPLVSLYSKQLQSMPADDVIKLVQPALTINGKKIPVAFKWMSTDAMIEAKKPRPEYRPPVIQSADRKLTPINELNKKAFNKRIEVRLVSGAVYKGTFTKVEGPLLYMMILNSAGSSDLALSTDSIQLVYILSDY